MVHAQIGSYTQELEYCCRMFGFRSSWVIESRLQQRRKGLRKQCLAQSCMLVSCIASSDMKIREITM